MLNTYLLIECAIEMLIKVHKDGFLHQCSLLSSQIDFDACNSVTVFLL